MGNEVDIKLPTAVLVGGTVIKEMNNRGCFSGFNVIKKYFGMSPIGLGEKTRVGNVPKERLTLPLRFDVNNDFKGFLKQNRSDYIFVDLQKALMPLLNINGTYCTYQKDNDDEFYIENAKFLEDPKEYPAERYFEKIESFAEIILKFYGSDRIILISTFVPEYYSVGGYIRKHKNVFEFRDIYKSLEEKFIEKTNCVYFDAAKYFFNCKNIGKPIKFAVFEDEFYDFSRNEFSNLAIGNSFRTTPDYSVFVKRYVKFYKELNKKPLSAFLNQSSAVDRFLMSSPPEFCLENIDGFCLLKQCEKMKKRKIPKCGIKKVFKAFLKAENGKFLTRKSATVLFLNNIAVKPLLEKIRNNSEIRFKKQINYYNYGEFFRNRKAVDPPLPIPIDVIGTCISRFVFNFNDRDFAVNNLAFHFMPILTDKRANYDKNLLDENNWTHRMLKLQLDCSLKNFMSDNHADWLVLDLFTLTAVTAFFVDNKPVCMAECDFAIKNGFQNIVVSEQYDSEFIVAELKKFADILMSIYGENIILIKSKRQVRKLDDTDKILPYTNEEVNSERNRKNDIFCKAFTEYTNCYLVDIADGFLSDDRAFVSLSPAHYEKECYYEEGKIIKKIITERPENRLFDTYSGKVALDRLIRFRKAQNDLSELEKIFNKNLLDKYLLTQSVEFLEQNYDTVIKIYDRNYKTEEQLLSDSDFVKLGLGE